MFCWSGLGANSFQFSKYPAINFSDPRQRFANRRDVSYEQASRFKELMGDTAQISLMLRRGGRVAIYLDRRTNPNVILGGGDENFITSRDYEIAAGRNLGPDDVEFGRAVVLLGDELTIGNFRYQVCGDVIGRPVALARPVSRAAEKS